MNYGNDHNPYAPPAQFGQVPAPMGASEFQFPAERGDRFAARVIDGLLSLVLIIPWMILLISLDFMSLGALRDNQLIESLKLYPAALPLAIYQWILLARTGQTIGKKFMRIKVVKADGGPVDFVSGVVLREWVMWFVGMIPCVGGLISLIGHLMIFSDDRRCLHDKIAGTIVIKTLVN